MWQSTGNANKKRISEIFNTLHIRPEAPELVRWLKTSGYTVCLITGSVSLYAQHVADKLEIEQYYANSELYFDNDGNLSGFHYTADQAAVKAEQLNQFCRKNDIEPTDCYAVGDSDNDIELFTATKRGVLLQGGSENEALKAAAWKTITNLSEVRVIIQADV